MASLCPGICRYTHHACPQMLPEQSTTAKDNAPHNRTGVLQGVLIAASKPANSIWFLNRLNLMIVKQLASQPDLHGFHARNVLLDMASGYKHDQISNRTSREAHLITTRKRRGTLGGGWEDGAAC